MGNSADKTAGLPPPPFYGRCAVERIFYVSSEVAPFAASGGLGDVLGSLPRAVRRRTGKGTEVGVIMPLYASIDEKWRCGMDSVHSGEFYLSWRRVAYRILLISQQGVDYYFIDCPQYFNRPAMYGEFDDGERFAVFCRAVIAFILDTDRIPDVLHANDWQTALTVIYLKTVFATEKRLFGVRTVFTVHNIAYQGRYDMRILSDVLDIHPMHRWAVEYRDEINLVKGALVLSDRVNTVSPRYAKELSDHFFGEGLSDIVATVRGGMQGILNGLDTAYFNPAALNIPYTYKTVAEGKRKNRCALVTDYILPESDAAPVLAFIGRLVEDKGVDLLLAALDSIRALGVRLLVLGMGDPQYERAFAQYSERYPDFIRFISRFDRELSKRIYAAADIFLMPSRREPCGLAQMIACRYGTVPVVRATGGLYDSILPYGRQGGCGFVFSEYTVEDFYYSVEDAVMLYRTDQTAWQRLTSYVMQKRFGWGASAEQYLSMYKEIRGEV